MALQVDEDIFKVVRDKSQALRDRSYCPYSKFAVGCCIATVGGKLYEGANIENASYGASICAERVALTQWAVNGREDIICIGISGGPLDVSDEAQSHAKVDSQTHTLMPNPCETVQSHTNTAVPESSFMPSSTAVVTPCGICRQFMREFAREPSNLPIIMFNADASKSMCKSLEDLLPFSFGPDSLMQ